MAVSRLERFDQRLPDPVLDPGDVHRDAGLSQAGLPVPDGQRDALVLPHGAADRVILGEPAPDPGPLGVDSGQVIRLLVDSVAKDGNLLLNVGPTGRGDFEPRAEQILTDVGRWVDRHDAAVHGAGPPGATVLTLPLARPEVEVPVIELDLGRAET